MEVKVYRTYRFTSGPFIVYTITGRKEPIAEIYRLDSGFLVLNATATGGYTRKFYKTHRGASDHARACVEEFCHTYWPNKEIKIQSIV